MAQLVLPRVQAIIVCDAIEESDQENAVHHLTGVRTDLEVFSFPTLCPRICVYVQLSGHYGEASCRVQIGHGSTDDAIYRTKPKTIAFDDPTVVLPMVFRLRNCVFPRPGLYYVQVLNEEKLIGERRLRVKEED